jgi:DNA end-binding protein Ku
MVSLKPCGRGIVLETLRYADEVNKAQGYFRDIEDAEPDEELLELAEALIDRKTAKFDPSKFHDRYVEALEELIERKRKGKTIHTDEDEEKPARGMNVVDLMAALKRSIDKPGGSGGRDKAPAGKSSARKAPAKKAIAKKPPAKKAAAHKPAAKAAPARKRA